MKANHNKAVIITNLFKVVVNISKSKNESKSQRYGIGLEKIEVVVNISKSKNESKSQREQIPYSICAGCGQYQ